MASWKKMAEAFGRASVRENNSKAGREFIKDAAKPHAPNDTKQASKGPKTWAQTREETASQPATDEVGRAFRKGQAEGESRNIDVADELAERPGAEFMDVSYDVDERASDVRLQKEFDKGFKEAIDRRKGKSGINRAAAEDLGLSADEIEMLDTDANRKLLIDLLKKNRDTGDVLRNFK